MIGLFKKKSLIVWIIRLKGNSKRSSGNRPFPGCRRSPFESEAKCEAIDMKMILYSRANTSYS